MSAFRKHPVFSAALVACAVAALGEGWCIYDRWAAARAAAVTLEQKKTELRAMGDLVPPPTRAVAAAIEADLARAQRALGAMQAELRGRGPAAERLRATKAPAARTDAYFDLATFVEHARDQAKSSGIDLRPGAERFGFSLYANEGPELDRIPAVFHERLIAQYLVESLLDAHPQALLSVQREPPLTKAERDARDAALAAAAAGGAASDAAAASLPDGPDFFVIDPRASARVSGYVDATAFRIAFTGQTNVLRAFLNKLASFELPVLVREVEVETATGEDAAAPAASADDAVPSAASVVLSATAPAAASKPVAPAAVKAPAVAPIVAKPLCRFTVTVEYIELVPAAGAAAEPGADAAKPTT